MLNPCVATSRYFGAIDASSERRDASVSLGAEHVRVDLNLAAPGAIDGETLGSVDRMLDDATLLDASARAFVRGALEDESQEPVKFWQFHHDEVEGYESLERAAFVDALALVRIGFYPDGAYGTGAFAVMDYALRGPKTDQLLVVKLLRDRSLLSIAWES
jgi:hypothetical protein